MSGGAARLRAAALALLALLLLELAAMAALVASAQPGDLPDPEPVSEVHDRVQENGNECPEVDECLREIGE